jgi:hypothetical protein
VFLVSLHCAAGQRLPVVNSPSLRAQTLGGWCLPHKRLTWHCNVTAYNSGRSSASRSSIREANICNDLRRAYLSTANYRLSTLKRLRSKSKFRVVCLVINITVRRLPLSWYGTPLLTGGRICVLHLLLLGSESSRTHIYLCLSLRCETPSTWRAKSPYLYHKGKGWPSYIPKHWVLFSSCVALTVAKLKDYNFATFNATKQPQQRHWEHTNSIIHHVG